MSLFPWLSLTFSMPSCRTRSPFFLPQRSRLIWKSCLFLSSFKHIGEKQCICYWLSFLIITELNANIFRQSKSQGNVISSHKRTGLRNILKCLRDRWSATKPLQQDTLTQNWLTHAMCFKTHYFGKTRQMSGEQPQYMRRQTDLKTTLWWDISLLLTQEHIITV